MTIHVGCFAHVPSDEMGIAYVCPGCYKTAGEDSEADPASTQTAVLRSGFAKGVISTPIHFNENDDDPRPACDLLDPPTDEEARAQGFEDARDWMARSLGGSQQSAPSYGRVLLSSRPLIEKVE